MPEEAPKAACGRSRNRRGRILGRRLICERLGHLEEHQIGSWEGDTLNSKRHKHAIVSLVEQKSSYALLAKLEKKTTDLVSNTVIKRLKPVSGRVQILTCDDGKEFADHGKIDRALGSTTHFADPYSSWQRGSNENLNGLIRQYIPNIRQLSTVTDDILVNIKKLLNYRPDKRLGYKARWRYLQIP